MGFEIAANCKHSTSKRIVQFDALKGLAIIMVVMGHIVDLNIGTLNRPELRDISMLLRLVHMPIFIFLAGLFDSSEKKKVASRSMSFLFLYILAKIIYMVSNRAMGAGPYFSLFSGNSRPWFMLAMAAWVPLARATRNIKLLPLLLVWIILALAVGYDDSIGAWLSLSKIIVFFPFYLVGYRIKPDTLLRYYSRRVWLYLGMATLAILITLFVVFGNVLWPYEQLLNAHLPYSEIPVQGCGAVERLIWYGLVALALSAYIEVFVHAGGRLLAWFGRRSLAIYLFHLPFTLTLVALGLFEALTPTAAGRFIAVLLSIPVAAISGMSPLYKFVTAYQKTFSGISERSAKCKSSEVD